MTEDHLSFDGDCGVRTGHENLPAAGDPTVYGPPFPLTSFYLLSAGVRAPRDFMAPNTCDERLAAAKPCKPSSALPPRTAMVLLSVAVVLLARLLRLGRAVRRHF